MEFDIEKKARDSIIKNGGNLIIKKEIDHT